MQGFKSGEFATALAELPSPYQCIRGRDGLFIINKNDIYIGKSLAKYGEWSQHELDLFRQLLSKSDHVIEVGANIGCHTVGICKMVPTGLVWAFEPQRLVFQNLCANITINALMNCDCRLYAMSCKEGIPVKIPDSDPNHAGNFGQASLEENSTESIHKTHSLDSEFEGLKQLKLLKIDAEGMEQKILKGGETLIKRTKPAIYVQNDRPEESEELIEQLLSFDYKLYWHITTLFNPENFRADQEDLFPGIASINMLCVPNSTESNITGLAEVKNTSEHPLKPKEFLF